MTHLFVFWASTSQSSLVDEVEQKFQWESLV